MNCLFVVGIGPGDPGHMTYECRHALEKADIFVGYKTYARLVHPLYPEKPVYTTSMREETERCKKAIALAEEGKCVAVLSSGDAGVYGMAGLILELAEGKNDLRVEVIPGVTAALSGAAALGAPLAHDFAVVSLSDLLTPLEIIGRRLASAAEGDFCIALYNPASRKRRDHLKWACGILMEHGKSPDTVCGYARNVGREDESKAVLTLEELQSTEVDMVTVVFIGNSMTKVINGKMVTPRGYQLG
ncbi:MAG TPA: precorrin-3B C(17)-methyltransferase [Bacillota bacterium]|nr:precorrin-3B C(17)-methyltransferase [Bacillota bacterium]